MKIYISGISGTGMGPLALMAKNAGIEVMGSDLAAGAIYDELATNNIEVKIGAQDGEFLRAHIDEIDWFVHTSALPADHPELVLAREAGIKVTKRDELTAYLIEKLGLKMVAVAGTHGKTTTTSMITFAALKLGLPVSYIVGTTLGFAPSGAYHPGDKFFIYEADEYDRNFLKFHPWLAVLPFVSYDHPDIYPTREDYLAAFEQFKSQCENVIENLPPDPRLTLAGEARRADATLAMAAVSAMAPEVDEAKIAEILNEFPGVGRRFERVADGAYTDYAHHPEEIAATIEMAKEEAALRGLKGVVVAYQPHQNTRQHEVWPGYKDAFVGVDKLFWLPTYLTRENPALEVLTPEKLISGLSNTEIAEPAEANDDLAEKLKKYQAVSPARYVPYRPIGSFA
ncbi:hypothetical protein IKZ77_00620 [Candidatus Saccharibacteria bacterium]|nr:hypothetical protein [Candidatus Saccharibacteria bacterium]